MHDTWQWSIPIWFQEQVKIILYEVTQPENSLCHMKQMKTKILKFPNQVEFCNNSLTPTSLIKQNTVQP